MTTTEFIKKWGMVGTRVIFDQTKELESDLTALINDEIEKYCKNIDLEL